MRARQGQEERDLAMIHEGIAEGVADTESRAEAAEKRANDLELDLEEAEKELELSRAREGALMEVIRLCRWGPDCAPADAGA